MAVAIWSICHKAKVLLGNPQNTFFSGAFYDRGNMSDRDITEELIEEWKAAWEVSNSKTTKIAFDAQHELFRSLWH
jgi:hypothetical protein